MNSKIKSICHLFLLLLVPIGARAEVCVIAYKDATLVPLRAPILAGDGVQVCAEDRVYEAVLKKELKYVRDDLHPDVSRAVKTIIELVSPRRRIVHIIRGGYYYSEFIDQALTNDGGHESSVSLTLLESPRKLVDQLGISELKFLYMIEDYVWGPQRVEKVKRKHRPVSLSIDGKLQPAGTWTESTGYRRIINIIFIDERTGSVGLEHSTIETQFADPVRNSDEFFRRFKLRGQKQATVMQFISTKEGESGFAYVEWFQNDQSLKRIRVADPGHDKFEVSIRITDGKAPPVY